MTQSPHPYGINQFHIFIMQAAVSFSSISMDSDTVHYCASSFAYNIHLYGDGLTDAAQMMADKANNGISAETKKECRAIEKAASVSIIDQWMSKRLTSQHSSDILHHKMKEYEVPLTNRLKQKCLYNKNEYNNNAEWIMNNFQNFKDPYLHSIFSLIVGFRGKISDIDILMQEYQYFSSILTRQEKHLSDTSNMIDIRN